MRGLGLPTGPRAQTQHCSIAKPCHQPVNKAGIAFSRGQPFIKPAAKGALRATAMRLHPGAFQTKFRIDRLASISQQPVKGRRIPARARQMRVMHLDSAVNTLPAKPQPPRGKTILVQNLGNILGQPVDGCLDIIGSCHRFSKIQHRQQRALGGNRGKALIDMAERGIKSFDQLAAKAVGQRRPWHAQNVTDMPQTSRCHCRNSAAIKTQRRQRQGCEQCGGHSGGGFSIRGRQPALYPPIAGKPPSGTAA